MGVSRQMFCIATFYLRCNKPFLSCECSLYCGRLDYNGFNVNVGAIHKKVQVLEEENLQLKFEVSLFSLQPQFHHW